MTETLKPSDFRRALEGLLKEYEDRGFLAPTVTDASYDPESKRITTTISVSWDDVAAIAWAHYGDGQTHEQVTAWLETISPAFREALCEVVFDDGSRRWLVRPGTLVVDYVYP